MLVRSSRQLDRAPLSISLLLCACALCSCVQEDEEDAQQQGCFAQHLIDAIALNQERRPMYSQQTGGASEPITDSLVQGEQVSLYFARRVDEAARPFVAQGIGVGCDEFVSMAMAPAFQERFHFEPEPLSSYVSGNAAAMREDLQGAYAQGSFVALSKRATERLEALRSPRAYHCMTRHVLESIIRISNLAPAHEQRASALGLGSTAAISSDMVALHLLALDQAVALDDQAAPLQAQGVPILCRDVPHVAPGL